MAHEERLVEKLLRGLGAAEGTDLNTSARETSEQRSRRLQMDGVVAPPDENTLNNFVEILYEPTSQDTICFNQDYPEQLIHKPELYQDYKKIFDWGLANPSENPIFAQSTGVTSNRFPSMCLRMAFHDNTIVGEDPVEYIARNLDNYGNWLGDPVMLPTSGGDASVL